MEGSTPIGKPFLSSSCPQMCPFWRPESTSPRVALRVALALGRLADAPAPAACLPSSSMHEQGSSLVAVHASGTPARHCGRLCCTAPDGGKAGGGPPDKTRWAPDGKCHPESGERSVFMRARAPWQKAGRTRRVVLRGPRGAPPLKRATARSVSKPTPCEPAAARVSNDSGHGRAARAGRASAVSRDLASWPAGRSHTGCFGRAPWERGRPARLFRRSGEHGKYSRRACALASCRP